MADTERLDPALLAEREANEEAKLDQLRIREVLVQALPEGIVRDLRVPDNRAGVGERRFLALGELLGILEV